MPSPLVESMLERTGLPRITAETYNAFLADNEQVVLFFCENPERYPESNDVAMVLPEILKEYPDLKGAIIDRSFERELQKQFDFTRWPALAFFVNGDYRGNMTGIQNWDDYTTQIPDLLSDSPTSIPLINLQETSA